MDEILHHCLRELAFDGDLGSNTSRLRDFIFGFYDHAGISPNQDETFCAYVWSLLVQQPNVVVGVLPEAISCEVWIAPQGSAKRKATARGEDLASNPPPKLDVISEPKATPLSILKQKYGETLRIATDADTILSAITGSHIRSPKLTPIVYTALQIITRGRDAGISVVELGKKSGYDQKTCFYLVRQLTELELVLKVRRGGIGTHFVIHKYFYERNLSWKAIRQEEEEAERVNVEKGETNDDEGDHYSLEEYDAVTFTPIDARHLSSYPLMSRRVIRLLQASTNFIHPSKDMLIKLGYSNPTKTDRRFFRTRINEMIQQGLIERVIVPNQQKKTVSLKCLRLLEGNSTSGAAAALDNGPEIDDTEIAQQPSIKFNASIHKQIIDLIEESGTGGMTLSDLSFSLHGFDTRTIELLLTRSEKNFPPPHLLHLHIVGIVEINGRERRHRYYTVGHYRQLVNEESLDNEIAAYDNLHLGNVRSFSDVGEEMFYKTGQDLNRYADSFKSRHDYRDKKKTRVYTNPILPDGKVKRGRPRKNAENTTLAEVRRKGKRKVGEDSPNDRPSKMFRVEASLEHIIPGKRGRGRPKQERKATVTTKTRQCGLGDKVVANAVPGKGSGLQATSVDDEMLLERFSLYNVQLEASDVSSVVHKTHLDNVAASSVATVQTNRRLDNGPEDALGIPAMAPPRTEAGISERDSSGSLPLSMNADPPNMALSPLGNASRVNVSHLRRENEFVRLLENSGGILGAHMKEFYENHIKLLEALAKHGEPTSTPPGTRIDKRTMVSTFTNLERKGRVKQLKTSIPTPTGLSRSAHIIYLPNVDDARLNAFLDDLGRIQSHLPHLGSYVKIDEHIEFGGGPSIRREFFPRSSQVERQGDDKTEKRTKKEKQQLFNYDDSEVRNIILSERTVMMQSYGFIMGKALQCRQLHLAILETIEKLAPSPNVVSYDKRIFDMTFFLHDFPVDLYCSLVAPLTHDEALSSFLANDLSRKTPVRDLPSNLQTSLQIGKTRARARFLDMLEKLRLLDLVTPLSPSESSNPWITCPVNGRHPTNFHNASLDGWTISTPALAPSYWLFHCSVPIRLWAAQEPDPPFWKTVSVSKYQDGVAYWQDLQNACLDRQLAPQIRDEGNSAARTNASAVRSFCRSTSWRSDYSLSWHQSQYLRQFMNSLGISPLDVPDSSERESLLSRLCWVTSAPLKVIEGYFISHKAKLAKNLEKIKEGEKRSENARVAFAKKSEEAQLQREHEWSSLLSRCNTMPSAAVRLKQIRKRFLQAASVKDKELWEKEIQEAVYATKLANTKGLKTSRQLPPNLAGLPTLPQSLTIEKLIEMQGPPIEHESHKGKRKREKEEEECVEQSKKAVRRHRFQWNADFDELARDASVIIRARCREQSRLDWAAFEQVFPAVPRNTVRQRLVHIKETPGNDTYLHRLEDGWYNVWQKYRGTKALPDANPLSPSDFDLVEHVRFLRTHVDKQALRVGISQATKNTVVIPSALENLQEQFQIVERERPIPDWEYIWNTTIEEGREKKLKRQSFSHFRTIFSTSVNISDKIVVAECAVKLAMGTPPERYDPKHASALLKAFGSEVIGTATRNLLNGGVLSKLQRDPNKRRPGRMCKISECNQNAIGGAVSQDTFHDAVLLLEEMDLNDLTWHDWPLIATDGDCAALIQLTSEDKVDFIIDTSVAQAARLILDWNSKKADDDHIETLIKVQYRLEGSDEGIFSESDTCGFSKENGVEVLSNHGLNEEGQLACCRKSSPIGLVDCIACLDDGWKMFCCSLDPDSCKRAEEILRIVNLAKEPGLKKSDLASLNSAPVCMDFPRLLNRMLAADIAQIHWTGYESLVLISARYVAKWSVKVSQTPVVYHFPRRWLDIRGQRVVDFWQSAIRAVLSCVIFRPGISQNEIRWRLRSVYDRQEISDVLGYVSTQGFLQVRHGGQNKFSQVDVFFPYDELEEVEAYWFIGHRHWYQA